MITVTLLRNLSDTAVPRNGYCNGVPVNTEETPTFTAKLYWRWDDTPEMTPKFLGSGLVGDTISVPFDPQGRSVRLFLIYATAEGIESDFDFTTADQALFVPEFGAGEENAPVYAIASESLGRGKVVDLFYDEGVLKARLASAADGSRPGDAFVDDDAAEGATIRVFFTGRIMYELSGLTPGLPIYLSETPGSVTHTPPEYRQRLGTALSDSTAIFEPHPMTIFYLTGGGARLTGGGAYLTR